MRNTTLTRESLLKQVAYDPVTSTFTWTARKPGVVKGKFGWLGNEGYPMVKINGETHSVHCLVWLVETGEYPDLEVDHINGIRHDNRFSNLRLLTKSDNIRNQRKAQKRNKSTGVLGVSYNIKRNKFSAQITVDSRKIWLGRYDTLAEAQKVYVEAKRKYHPSSTL